MSQASAQTLRRYVVTVGCFDCFHYGHEALLSHMQLEGDFLLVGVHDDESIFINKKLKVAQQLEDRKRIVESFASNIETFDVCEPDPTNALKALYNKHQTYCTENGIQTEWTYVRGLDMPRFPGRSFVESVMNIVWHDYTSTVSSTLIRNEILPLSASLVSFAKERVINESFLNLLERSANWDHKVVMKYLLAAVDRSVGEKTSSTYPFLGRSPRHSEENDLNVPNILDRGQISPRPSTTEREQVLCEIITALFTLFQNRKDEAVPAMKSQQLVRQASKKSVLEGSSANTST